MQAPAIQGIVETALHVKSVARSTEFYERLFGIEKMLGDDRFSALPLPGGQVLLLFLIGGTGAPVPIPGGLIPPHGGSGDLHVAFKIAADELAAWERRLGELGIEIESTVKWERGGTSLYFRDLDHHLIELITPGCWPVY
jgi:catechol 2,3-dioxygenase-like lactoylglutathione lyase family enzyme